MKEYIFNILFICISLLVCIYGIKRIIIFFRIKSIFTNNIFSKKIINKEYIFILPVYHEEKLISGTMEHISQHLINHKNIKLIIVGTSKERDENGINRTLKLATTLNKLNEKIYIIEADTKGYMAHQINYAADYIKNTLKYDLKETWIHTLNIDSRISEDSIDEIFNEISKGEKIMIQSTIFTLNFGKLLLFGKGTSIYQSRRTIVEEQYRILFNKYISKYKLFHIVGHGLIINLDKFFKLKNFPEDTINEDLHFGFYLSINGENIVPISKYEIGDMPTSVLERFKQISGWFIGVLEFYKYPKSYMKKFGKKMNLKLLIFAIQGWVNIFKWFFSSYFLLFIIIYITIITQRVEYISLGLFSLLMYWIHYYLVFNYLYKKKFIGKFNTYYLLSSIFISLVVSIPLTLGFIKYILYKIGLIGFIKNKSNHE